MLYLPVVVLLYTFLAAKINGSAFLRLLWTISLMHTCWQYTGIVYMFKCESSQCISGEDYL